MLNSKYKEQDAKREAEVQRIENERNDIREAKGKATVEINTITDQIKIDAADRAKRDEEMQAENEGKEAKI